MAPARTPNDIVQKVHDVAVKGLARAEIKDKYATLGIDPAPMSSSELARFIDSEIAHWAKLVKLAGIQPE
jgi:tripartite-type tricarboxylate transporter receptor subunit TctC